MRDAIEFTMDALGQAVVMDVDTSVYSQVAVFKAAYWWSDRCYLYMRRSNKDAEHLLIEMREKSPSQQQALEKLAKEFCNYLLDQQVRQYVLSETQTVRNLLLEKAFREGRSHHDPQRVGSESNIA